MDTNFDSILNHTPEAKPGLTPAEWGEKQKEKRETLYAMADQVTQEAAVDPERFRAYLDVQARFDDYSPLNALLILAQRPDAVRLGDFEHWKSLGTYIKPGSKGFDIMAPNGTYLDSNGAVRQRFSPKRVFDVRQVELGALKLQKTLARATEKDIIMAMVKAYGGAVQVVPAEALPEDGKYAFTQEGVLQLREGLSFSEAVSILAYTLADRETRRREGELDSPGLAMYCAQYMLCKKYGTDTQDFGFDFVGDIFAEKSVQEIRAQLGEIRNVGHDLIKRVEQRLNEQEQHRQKAAPEAAR